MKSRNNHLKNVTKRNVPIIGAAAVAVIAAVAFLVYTNVGKGNSSLAGNLNKAQEGGDVVILKSYINETAQFFPYKADGTNMELLAFKASDGTIRTAFNTCQVCYDSGRGYYVQDGDVLVCQNCGNRYPADRVGIDQNGCNPMPIFESDRTENDETITIPEDFIVRYKDFFSRWKKS